MMKLLTAPFRFLGKVLKFCFFYILIGPITLLFYCFKWIFKGFK